MTFLEEISEDSPTHRTGRLWAVLPRFYLPSHTRGKTALVSLKSSALTDLSEVLRRRVGGQRVAHLSTFPDRSPGEPGMQKVVGESRIMREELVLFYVDR